NGRKVSGAETNDALGKIVQDVPVVEPNFTKTDTWTFDASGTMSKHISATYKGGGPGLDITHKGERGSDGDGLIVKNTETRRVEQQVPAGESETVETAYNVRSSVLGGKVLTELYGSGGKRSTKVYAGR